MNIRFTGRHVGIPDADREWLERKVEGLSRFHRHFQDLEIRVEMDGELLERVELAANLGHQHRAVAKVEAAGFRAAFEKAAAALKKQLVKEKDKVVGRRRGSARRRRPEGRIP